MTTSHLGGFIHGSDPNTWYPELWTWLMLHYQVQTMLDVGAGEGYTARYWRDALGCRVTAIEGSPEAVSASVIPERTTRHDFTRGAFNRGPVDLAWCCEVVEHIDARYVRNVLNTFALAKVVVLTHGVPGQPGVHHVNCQPSTYWARHLAALGYHLDYRATRKARTLGHVYFTKTGMIFTKQPRLLPSVLAVHLLNLEWFPRRVWRHLRQRGIGSVVRIART